MKVSIITPSFNRSAIVHETAQSIFSQTYQNWEWVICDDGSTDESLTLLQGYANRDSRVKLIVRNRNPKGASTCRNLAVEAATGDCLIFLDTDDLLSEICLEQRVKAMQEDDEIDFLIFPMLMFKNSPNDLNILWNIDKSIDDVTRVLFGDAICQGTGTIWKKQSFVNIGMWREDLSIWQDVELHLRALLNNLKYKKKMNLKPDIFIRISENSLSRTGYHNYIKFKSRFNVFRDILNLANGKNLVGEYRLGFRHMALDLINSSAINNFSLEFNELLEFCRNMALFEDAEFRFLRIYRLLRKLKLYKFKLLNSFFTLRLNKMDINFEVTLNKVKYDGDLCV